MDVTRMGEMDTTSANSSTSSSLTAGPSAKKKRLMSGFSELVERMKTIGRSKESIPWLQITTHLIAAHPSFPETHELKELLAFVVDVTHDCREYDMVAHCNRLFRIITIALFEHRGDSKELAQSSLQPDSISKLWDSIWNCLAANQCHAESYLLIATLLYYRLTTTVMARQTIQHLVRPGHSVPCERFSMLCLAAYLQRYKLPERNTFHSSGMSDTQLSFTLSWGTDPVGDRSIRSLLSEWLLHRQVKLPFVTLFTASNISVPSKGKRFRTRRSTSSQTVCSSLHETSNASWSRVACLTVSFTASKCFRRTLQ